MDFWSQHTALFVVGLVLWPRALLIYFGLIPPMSIPSIFGIAFIPRIFLAGILTPMYWETNPTLIAICWILAVALDIVAIVTKLKMQSEMLSIWQKNMGS